MKGQDVRKLYSVIWLTILLSLFIATCNPVSTPTQESILVVSETSTLQSAPSPSETSTETMTATQLPSPVSSPTLEPSLTASSIPTSSVSTATFVMNANCRFGPGTAYGVVTSFLKDQTVEIVGRNPDLNNTWWYVNNPNSTQRCWVSMVTANASGDLNALPIINPPPLPPTPTFTFTPIAPPPVSVTATRE